VLLYARVFFLGARYALRLRAIWASVKGVLLTTPNTCLKALVGSRFLARRLPSASNWPLIWIIASMSWGSSSAEGVRDGMGEFIMTTDYK